MKAATFDKFRHLVYEHSGIRIRDGKEVMLSARISKRKRFLGIDDDDGYFDHVESDPSGEELLNLLDVVSTNLTSFFRESEHFDLLQTVVDGWLKRGARRLRVWSAASSTGEEPYTIAMVLHRMLADFPAAVDLKILATDISRSVLTKAAEGVYDAARLAGMPETYRRTAFERTADGFRVIQPIRDLVAYRWLNLSTPPFPMRGPMDVIFCRNVMIYFDQPVRQRLLAEAFRLLKPGGYLIVGHTESLTDAPGLFQRVSSSVYMKG